MPGAGGHGLDEAVLGALFSQSPVGLHVLDTRLRLIRVNTAASLRRDFPVAHMRGWALADVLSALNAHAPGEIEARVRRVLETGKPAEDLRITARSRRNPAVRAVVSAACFRLEDDGGVPLGVAVAVTDITARTKAEARLGLLQRAAGRVGTTLDLFRTARELCDLVVPELADCVAVDVMDSVLRGDAPLAGTATAGAPVRHAAYGSATDGPRHGLPTAAEIGTHLAGTPYRQAVRDLAPVLIAHLDTSAGADGGWTQALRARGADLRAAGVRSMMVVPMRARGFVLGLACLYRRDNPTPFDHEDLAFAEQLMSRAALCLDNARVYGRERSVARMIRRDLGHAGAAVCSAVETAHSHLPTGTGGAWIDVIPLPGARVALAAGDITGRTADAAASMGRLRAVVAALADLDLPPAEILERVHDLASRPERCPERGPGEPTTEEDWPATCVCVVYDPVTRSCTVAGAGHPPPILIHADGETEVIDLPAAPPLGEGVARYASVQRVLPEGSTLALYNRALVGGGSDGGHPPLERLRRVTTAAHSSLQDLSDAIVDAFVPAQPLQDAVLLLARVHTLGADRTASWELPHTPEAVAQARRLATAQLGRWGLDDLAESTALVVSELVTNAVRHAAHGPIALRLIRDRTLICEVTDDSSTAPHLRRAADADEGGRGLYITAQLTDRWGVRTVPRGKTIWTEQTLPQDPH